MSRNVITLIFVCCFTMEISSEKLIIGKQLHLCVNNTRCWYIYKKATTLPGHIISHDHCHVCGPRLTIVMWHIVVCICAYTGVYVINAHISTT